MAVQHDALNMKPCALKSGTLQVHCFHTEQNESSCEHICSNTEQTLRRCGTKREFEEIDLCYQTYSHDSRHCRHMLSGHVFQLVASEICVTLQPDTQSTKYSASGF